MKTHWHCRLIFLALILGRNSFGRRSLHAIGGTPNPYEQAISIIGRTLSPFDEDNLIPCYGFGDSKCFFPLFSFLPFEALIPCYALIISETYLSAFYVLASTREQSVFSFYPDNRPCHGFEEALARYRDIVPHLKLSGCVHHIFFVLMTFES